jgi:hypothetical protein
MFSKMVVDSDTFLDMPITARLLYFHIGMEAKDKGILNNIFSIARAVGCSSSDVQTLVDNGFVKLREAPPGEFFTWQIVHWDENNGISANAKERNNHTYRQWRSKVIERDGRCMECGAEENLHAHHIKNFAEFPQLRTELSNGITLCQSCHRKLHKEQRKNGRS